MPDLGPVHRFCDHPIEGVNWRPTRFVDELCISCVCPLWRDFSEYCAIAMLTLSMPVVPRSQHPRMRWAVSLGSRAFRERRMGQLRFAYHNSERFEGEKTVAVVFQENP
ncbi:hypothetical protein MTO96_004546 [Rhipicephalus appendiculatus]